MVESRIKEMIAPTVESMGLVLWGVEYIAQGRHGTLRIYIHNDDGISVEHCADVSRQVSGILDVEDPISSAYTLEVSSPGLDSPLFELAHYQAFIGEQVKLRLRVNYEGRRNFKGTIASVEEGDVVLRVDDEEFLFPIESIERANVVHQFD